MQALEKIPKQAVSSGAIPVVIERQITFINTLVEISPPPFCNVCKKYILSRSCSNGKTPQKLSYYQETFPLKITNIICIPLFRM